MPYVFERGLVVCYPCCLYMEFSVSGWDGWDEAMSGVTPLGSGPRSWLGQIAGPFSGVYLVGPELGEQEQLVFELLGELLVQLRRLWFQGWQYGIHPGRRSFDWLGLVNPEHFGSLGFHQFLGMNS